MFFSYSSILFTIKPVWWREIINVICWLTYQQKNSRKRDIHHVLFPVSYAAFASGQALLHEYPYTRIYNAGSIQICFLSLSGNTSYQGTYNQTHTLRSYTRLPLPVKTGCKYTC